MAEYTDDLLDSVEINPEKSAAGAVIWLHGLGADGHDFEPIVSELRLPEELPIRFVFPHAPERPVTINAGVVMRAWYDVIDVGPCREINVEELLEAADFLRALIRNEVNSGLPPERIVLAGFSQGAAVALHVALRYPERLAGVLALSTYLPTIESVEKEASKANQDIPIMMGHGNADPMIPIALAVRTRRELTRLAYNVLWHEYPMQHGVCAQEIEDIRTWILEVFSHQGV